MVRYSSVQNYSDQNTKTISSGDKLPINGGKLIVERVENVPGSCAGAGSGEFDKYRTARRREIDRLNQIEQGEKSRLEDEMRQKKLEQNKRECEERTRKNADKRKKKKLRTLKLKANKNGTASTKEVDPDCDDVDDDDENEEGGKEAEEEFIDQLEPVNKES
jgi:hypothetical protein